jgi:hypothetical protein
MEETSNDSANTSAEAVNQGLQAIHAFHAQQSTLVPRIYLFFVIH